MTITMALGLIIAGFFLLMWSADLLVDNASELGQRLGVSSFLIGIVVIGFGTSAPEMFVSAVAALKDQGNLALGNALGSNITNIGLVLGLAALLRPLPVTATTARKDIPIVITVGAIAIFLVSDGVLSHTDGFFLLALLIGYLVWSARNSEGFGGEPSIENLAKDPHELDLSLLNHPKGKSTKTAVMWTIGSIILLMIASQMLVEGAVTIARSMGVSNLVIGLTIIAIGTSLPELAAAIAAARKGAHDMIIGNIIGSNVFNTLGVLGLTGAIQTTKIDTTALARDFPIMLLFTIAMFLFANSKGHFSRREGASMLTAYVVYICYLVFTTLK
ncbi:MAG: cation:H+ antiporter [Dinoroseobacter sp.]|jgi:cation:H+ antiporter